MRENSVVHGVLFRIDEAERIDLDKAEGLGHGYELCVASIVCAQQRFSAFFYIAQEGYHTEAKPYEWYMNFARAGAYEHQLPQYYQDRLAGWTCRIDCDATRRKRNQEIIRSAELGVEFGWF